MRSNPPLSVVFVHGWSCDRSYWKEQLDYFAEVHRTVSTGMFVPESDPILKAWIVKDMASGPPQVGVGALRANILWPSTTRSDALAALRVPVRLINFMMEKPKTFNALLSSTMADFAK